MEANINPTDQYQIQRGDSLYKIAQKRLPPGAGHKDIMSAISQMAHENGIVDPDRIQAGATLQMPANLNPQAPPEQMQPPGAAPLDSSLAGLGGAPTPDMGPGMSVTPEQMNTALAPGMSVTPGQMDMAMAPEISPPQMADVNISPPGANMAPQASPRLSITQEQMDQLLASPPPGMRSPLFHNPNAPVMSPQVGFPDVPVMGQVPPPPMPEISPPKPSEVKISKSKKKKKKR